MKKLLFVFSVLTLLSYGCNRSNENTSGTGTGIQKEEQRGTNDFQNLDETGSEAEAQRDAQGTSNMDNMNNGGPGSGTDPQGGEQE